MATTTSSPEHDVAKWRRAGEDAFSKKQFKPAIQAFTSLINAEPANERNYYKRFRVYLSERKYAHAVADLEKALALAPEYKVALYQLGKLHLMLGQCDAAVVDFDKYAALLDPGHDGIQTDLDHARECVAKLTEAEGAQARGDYAEVHSILSQLLEHTAVASVVLLLERAQMSVSMNQPFDAIADAGAVLKLDPNHIATLHFRGQLFYEIGDRQSLETALQHYRQALHSDPEHKGIKSDYRKVKKLKKLMTSIDDYMSAQQFDSAVDSLQLAMDIDPTLDSIHQRFWLQLCEAQTKLENKRESSRCCEKAVVMDDSNARAYGLLGEALILSEEFEEAVRVYTKATELDSTDRALAEGLQRAQVALKQSKTKNYYKILGVSRTAPVKAIKKAYRKKALEFHPDKHSDAEERVQEEVRKKFQDIAEAYEVLSSEELRKKYDRGEDVTGNEPQQQQRHHHHHGFGGGQRFHFNFG